jgi:hypothetical protein
MPSPATLRDSTEIVLPREVVDDLRTDLEAEFTLTIVDRGDVVKIIGSPIVIKEVGQFLAHRGVPVP